MSTYYTLTALSNDDTGDSKFLGYFEELPLAEACQHPQAREVYDGDTWVRYQCPLCAHQWCEDLPE